MSNSDQDTQSETHHEESSIEDPYTVSEHVVNVEGDTSRPEVFIETTPKDLKPHNEVSLIRDSDAMELYEQLGDYLRSEGYNV